MPSSSARSPLKAYPNPCTVRSSIAFRARSPIAARISVTTLVRLDSERKTWPQTSAWISSFETALGALRSSSSRSPYAFGERWTVRPARKTSRVSESKRQSRKRFRILSGKKLGKLLEDRDDFSSGSKQPYLRFGGRSQSRNQVRRTREKGGGDAKQRRVRVDGGQGSRDLGIRVRDVDRSTFGEFRSWAVGAGDASLQPGDRPARRRLRARPVPAAQ